jgi:hypothetical protein
MTNETSNRLCYECGSWAGRCLCAAGSCPKCGEAFAPDADRVCSPCDVLDLPPSRRWAFSVRPRDERPTVPVLPLSMRGIVAADPEMVLHRRPGVSL